MTEFRRLEAEQLPAHEPVVGASAWDDEATRSAVGPNWRRRGVVLGALVLAAALSASGSGVAWVGSIATFSLLVSVIVGGVLGRRDRRRLRVALESGPWQLANVVVLAEMLGRDLSKLETISARGHKRGGVHYGEKVVAIVDPATGEVRGTWLPLTRPHPWPGLDERRWAWFVATPDGDAAIASIDRLRIVALRRGHRFGKALHDHAWNVLRSTDVPPAPGRTPMVVGDAGVTHPPGEAERWPNRPMSARARVAIVAVLLAVTGLMGVSDTLAHQAKVDHNRYLLADGIEAHAEVTGHRSGGSSPDRVSIRILDGPYTGFSGTRTVARGSKARPGDVVTVFHAPDDVDDLLIVGYDQDVRSTGWVLLIVTAVVAGSLWASHRSATGPTRSDTRGPEPTSDA